jgi:protein-disulfide isomerase
MTLRPIFCAFLLALLSSTAGAQARGGVSLAGVGHDEGGSSAGVFIVEFADFGCGYCAKFNVETYPRIRTAYIEPGIARMKMVPYVTGMFKHSREVSEAAECAAGQSAFKRMHDLLYVKRKEWQASKDIRVTIDGYAKQLGLDRQAFGKCLMNPEIAQRVQRHTALARQLGINGTPTFFVNGRRVPGAVPYEVFQQVIASVSR